MCCQPVESWLEKIEEPPRKKKYKKRKNITARANLAAGQTSGQPRHDLDSLPLHRRAKQQLLSATYAFAMTMTATHDDDDVGSEYEHWGADNTADQTQAVAAPGYDSHNGLHQHTYIPAGAAVPSPSPEAPKILPAPLQQVIYAQPPAQYLTYPPSQYGYACAVPAYYPYPAAPQVVGYPGVPQMAGYPVYNPVYQPAAQPIAYAPAMPGPQVHAWQGRTKAEVEEDNMKIAKREGAYDKRKVQPVGVKDEQMMWVVETDGSHTLRAFVSIKELKGEWKKDPRFDDSYYFVREEEKEKEEGPEKKKAKTGGGKTKDKKKVDLL